MKRLLLLSNSQVYGTEYLAYYKETIAKFFQEIQEIVFIPYAIHDGEDYVTDVEKIFFPLGKKILFLHREKDKKKTIRSAKALFIGGGNTFRLLNQLYQEDLIELIQKKVLEGMLYMGASAGSNVACPTIKTTNDMPIVFPPSLDALSIFPYQINAHYIDEDTSSKHMGESRAKRIHEFHEENNTPVIGLREGAWLEVINNTINLEGTGAVIFEKNKPQFPIIKGVLPNLN